MLTVRSLGGVTYPHGDWFTTTTHSLDFAQSSSLLAMSEPATRKPTLIESMACGGSAACFAVNFTHPIELVKTRMQVSGGSIGSTCSAVMADEGILAFWKGLPFAWGRELSYTSVKLGACKS